jgi:hypothetical protein
VGAPADAAGDGLALVTGLGGAREHGVLGGYPALGGAAEEGGLTVFDADGAEDLSVLFVL